MNNNANETYIELSYITKNMRYGSTENYFDNADELKIFLEKNKDDIMVLGIRHVFYYYNAKDFFDDQ